MTSAQIPRAPERPRPVVELVQARRFYRLNDDANKTSEVLGLDDINLTVETGEFVSIMGASGSGKSTLLNVLGTLDRLDAGDYFLDGEATQKLTDAELSHLRNQRLGFVFQSFHLLPRYTAEENVELPLVYARLSKAERKLKVAAALERVGLSERSHHLPTQLSGGQQQRVAIARALVNRPSLLLADEPTGALDSKTTQEILSIFRALNDEGVTIVMVTHDAEVARAGKRIVRMRDARVVADDAVENRALTQAAVVH